jgi:hypothetical protein
LLFTTFLIYRVIYDISTCRQFKYRNYHSKDYKYTTQLGVILKREYPGKIEEKDDDGVITNTRPALEWYDYYHDGTLDFQQRTAADRVKEEFWVSIM